MRRHVLEASDSTLEEIRTWLFCQHGVKVSVGCLWNALRRLKLPLKKSHNTLPNRIAKMSRARVNSGVRLKAG